MHIPVHKRSNPFLPKIHLHLNPVAKVFMISEAFFWSGWNILLPLISVFALKEISTASLEKISFAYSSYLLMRVVGSIGSGLLVNRLNAAQKNLFIITGILVVNLAYISFIAVTSLPSMFIFYALTGICTGLISPIRAGLFSSHMDKNQETAEWGFLDAIVLTSIALAASISGLLVNRYGYQYVFYFSALLNTFSVIPYIYLYRKKTY